MIYQKNTELVSYNIYSSIVNTDNFNLVGSINAGNDTYSFNDVISEASNSAYKYKVTAVDSCGNESRLDNAYQISSCYLDVSSNSNLVQLSFNAFQGFNHNTYDIYRSNNNDEYELVGSIPWLGDSNLNWLDLNPPSDGCNNYFVQTTNLDCSFSEVSRSNIVSVCQENEEINCDTIYIDNFIIDTIYVDNFIIDTIYVDNFIIDTITEYVDVIITEFVDCDTGLPCDSEILEIINNSKKYGKIYNLLGQEILRREGIYIEGGEVKFRLK